MTPQTAFPALLTPELLEQASHSMPRDWLTPALSQAPSHWRLANEAPLREADAALRALFLHTYRLISENGDAGRKPLERIKFSTIDFDRLPSRRKSADDRYGEGFYAAVCASSQILVDRSPGPDRTTLLEALSEFLRFDTPELSMDRGRATRALEAIWEDMNIGWFN